MSSSYGNRIKVQIFGQSHSKAIGVVMDGIPAGIRMTWINCMDLWKDELLAEIYSTQRRERHA